MIDLLIKFSTLLILRSDYLENIKLVDAGIKEMSELIEDFYDNDGKTAYVMSSDHGMTDWGKWTSSVNHCKNIYYCHMKIICLYPSKQSFRG